MTTLNTRTDDEKVTASFVFYYSFADMISKIPDRDIRLQAYEMLFDYAMFGIEPQNENWVVDMVFSAIKPQIDANNRRRKNGKKGGRKPAQETAIAQAQPAAQAEAQAEAVAQAETQARVEEAARAQAEAAVQPAMQAEPTAQIEPTMQVEAAAQPTPAAQTQTAVQGRPVTQAQWFVQAETAMQAEPEARQAEQLEKIVHLGENQYPTTPTELGRFEKFAYKLFEQYHDGGKPNLVDIERVLERTYTRIERPDGEAIAAFDRDKADLLDYAFEQAKAADKLNWKYLDGMYRNFLVRGIRTGVEARQYDLERLQRFL